jgi:ribonuclease P protein component
MQRELRLRQAADFRRSREVGRSYSRGWLKMSVVANELPHNRYGIVIGRQIGKAVIRNRLRRQIQDVLRTLHPSFLQGVDIVLIVRSGAVGQPFARIQETIELLARQAGLFKGTAQP